MLMAFLSSSCLFGATALIMPPAYKSESVLMVRLGPEYLVNADPANTAAFEENRLIQASEAAMLTAPELIERVIQEIGLARLYPALAASIGSANPNAAHTAMEQAILRFSHHLSALPVKETTLLDVTYKNADPAAAGAALRQLVEDYLQMRRKHFEYANGNALSSELAATKARLDTATRRLDTFRHQARISDFDSQSAHLYTERGDVVSVRDKALADIAGLTEEVASLRAALDQIGVSVVLRTETTDSEGMRAVRLADAQLRLKENELRIAMKPGAPQLEDAAELVGLTQPLLHSMASQPALTRVTGRPQAYESVQAALKQNEADLEAARARLRAALTQISDIDRAIASLNANEAPLHQLQREQKVAEDAFFQAGHRVTEAVAHDKMMEAAKPNVVVVQAARVPFQETWTRAVVAALGPVLGLLLAGLIAYVDEMGQSRQFAAE
jgi:uncharacterized protein involved in exopolysaccharide biosynthesis